MNQIEVDLPSRPQASCKVKLRSQISDLREQAGMTQRELADCIGVTGTTIANWEKGRRGLEWFDRIIRLCRALNCSPEELVKYIPATDIDDDEALNGLSFSEMLDLLGTNPTDRAPNSKGLFHQLTPHSKDKQLESS